MNVCPDTSFICSLYRKQHTSAQAAAYQKTLPGPLPVSTFLLLEFRQSVRFQNRLFEKDRSKGFSKTEGAAMLRALQSDLAGDMLEMVAPDWADVHRIAEDLSARHTESGGHRLTDILHVATAIHLGAEQFLTFDANQKKLAEAEGMLAPL
jgi:predicted nucleic acid-binding protein